MDVTVGEIGWTVVGAVAVATAAHGITSIVRDMRHSETRTTEPSEKIASKEDQ